MKTTNFFKINGKPLLVPDSGVGFDFEDLDDASSGRDESGFMHRFVVRYDVGKWSFSYYCITEEERRYLESLFPKAPNFEFTHPSEENSDILITETCYRSKRSLSWFNAKEGVWKNYRFNIIQC